MIPKRKERIKALRISFQSFNCVKVIQLFETQVSTSMTHRCNFCNNGVSWLMSECCLKRAIHHGDLNAPKMSWKFQVLLEKSPILQLSVRPEKKKLKCLNSFHQFHGEINDASSV